MLAITLADLRYRYRQFLIAVVGGGVVLAMAILLSGLANGFKTEINSSIASVATFDQAVIGHLAAEPGVRSAAGLALLPQEVLRTGSRQVTVNVLAVQPGGLGSPRPASGAPLA